MLIKIKVPEGANVKVNDPNTGSSYILHAYPRVLDLPLDIPYSADPRQPRAKSITVPKISNSLASNDGRFHLLNRGITISAQSTRYDSSSGILLLEWPDEEDDELYGIIDGGHTYLALRDIVSKATSGKLYKDRPVSVDAQYVHLEVLVRVQEHLADIAEARNFSVSLKQWTLEGYKKRFEWFLEAIGPTKAQYIRISENDDQQVGILELIQVLSALNNGLFPNGEAPLEAYKNAGKCLAYFVDAEDKYGFRKMASVAESILFMYDYIRKTWKDRYNEEDEDGRRGRLGKTVEQNERKRRRTQMTSYFFLNTTVPWVGGSEDFPVEKGFAIPAISALRPLLILGPDGQYYWYQDPKNFWDLHGARIVKQIMRASDNMGNNPHIVGRDAQLYQSLYTTVRGILLEEWAKSQGDALPF